MNTVDAGVNMGEAGVNTREVGVVTGKAGSPLVICSERRSFPFTSENKEKALRYQPLGQLRKGRQRICVS